MSWNDVRQVAGRPPVYFIAKVQPADLPRLCALGFDGRQLSFYARMVLLALIAASATPEFQNGLTEFALAGITILSYHNLGEALAELVRMDLVERVAT